MSYHRRGRARRALLIESFIRLDCVSPLVFLRFLRLLGENWVDVKLLYLLIKGLLWSLKRQFDKLGTLS